MSANGASGKGPPDRYGGGDPKAADTTAITKQLIATTTEATGCAHDCRRTGRHETAYAAAWRRGFRRGWSDALRVVARRLPPHTWTTLAEVADQAGGDD